MVTVSVEITGETSHAKDQQNIFDLADVDFKEVCDVVTPYSLLRSMGDVLKTRKTKDIFWKAIWPAGKCEFVCKMRRSPEKKSITIASNKEIRRKLFLLPVLLKAFIDIEISS